MVLRIFQDPSEMTKLRITYFINKRYIGLCLLFRRNDGIIQLYNKYCTKINLK